MNNRYLTNIILIITVVALYWLNQSPKQDETIIDTLSTINSENIDHIKISPLETQQVEIVKKDGAWYINQPISAPASKARVDLLLSILQAPIRAKLQIEQSTDLGRFGFSETSPSLQLNDQLFTFGSTETISQLRYVLYKNTLYLTHDQIYPLFTTSANSYIENHVIAKTATLVQLSLPTVNQHDRLSNTIINITKNEQGQWQSDHADLSSDQLLLLVDNWQFVSATQTVKDQLHLQTLKQKPSYPIEVWYENHNSAIEFNVVQTRSGLTIYNEQTELIYLLPNSVLNQLFPKVM